MSNVSMEARAAVSSAGPGSRQTASFLVGIVILLVSAAIFVPGLVIVRAVTTDDCLYAWVGRNIVTGQGISDWQGPHTMFPPGYPVLIGAAYLLTGNLETACRVIAVLMAIGTVLVITALARRIISPGAAIVAGLLAAANPSLIALTYEGGSEVPFAFFCSLAMLGAYVSFQGKALGSFATGLCVGAAYLIRPEAVLWAPVYFIGLWVFRKKKRLHVAALFLLGLLICVVPYMMFLHHHLGYWTLSGKSKTLVVDNPGVTSNPEKTLYSIGDKGQGYSGDDVQRKPHTIKSFARNYLKNSKSEAGALIRMFGIPSLILVLGSMLSLLNRRQFPAVLITTLLPLPILLAMPMFYIRDRYLSAVIPMMLLWVVWGLVLGIKNRHVWIKGVSVVLVCCSLAFGVQKFVSTISYVKESPYAEHREAGMWLAKHSQPGEAVMNRKPWVSFYADRPWIITPLGTYDDTMQFGLDRRMRYLVVDAEYTVKSRPALEALIDPSDAGRGIRPVYTDRSGSDTGENKLVIYELTTPITKRQAFESRMRSRP